MTDYFRTKARQAEKNYNRMRREQFKSEHSKEIRNDEDRFDLFDRLKMKVNKFKRLRKEKRQQRTKRRIQNI